MTLNWSSFLWRHLAGTRVAPGPEIPYCLMKYLNKAYKLDLSSEVYPYNGKAATLRFKRAMRQNTAASSAAVERDAQEVARAIFIEMKVFQHRQP